MLYYLENDYTKLVEKVQQLQVSPDQITRLNALITQMIYSVDLTEKQLIDLVALQRMSYHESMLVFNPLERQIQELNNELELYKQYGNEGLKLIGYKIVGPEFDIIDQQEYAFVKVLYYLSLTNVVEEGGNGEDGNVYVEYVLEENDMGFWEIKGWGNVGEFLTVD